MIRCAPMLDLLERLGFDFDSLDSGRSLKWQQRIWPGRRPQSICSQLVEDGRWVLVWIIGRKHSIRSYERYR